MRGGNSRNISPKQEKHQRNVMRGETEAIRRGDTMYENSIGGYALASHESDDSKRAVGRNAVKNKAMNAEKMDDDSVPTRVLAKKAHLENPEGENNRNLNEQRAVGVEALKVGAGRSWLFPDNEIDPKKLKKLTKDKVPDIGLLNGKLSITATIDKIGPARMEIPRKGGGEPLSPQDAYLKADTNAAFEGGHGNAHHNPAFAVANHSHSIMFKDLPSGYRKGVLAHRKYLMNNATPSGLNITVTTKPYVEQMRLAILELYHMIIDSPEMSAEQIDAMVTADAKAKAKLGQKQAEPTPDTSYYFQNPGPEAGGGVPPTT